VFYTLKIGEDVNNDVIFNGKESIFRYWLTVILYLIDDIVDTIFIFGSALLEIMVYLQTYYIFYCIQRKHYNSLKTNIIAEKYFKLQSLRYHEIELQSIEVMINELIGFVPIFSLTDIFINSCIIITYVSTTSQSIWRSLYFSTDLVISYILVFVIIIIVSHLNSAYDINKINRIVNRSFLHIDSKDQRFQLEMILYSQELSNRYNNKPKSCGLFRINLRLILGFINAVITFSVMCVQLKTD
jgi:hypothetical protein